GAGISLRLVARAAPAFVDGGTVTAGNSCPLNDGAAVAVVTSRARARRLGCQRMLGFVDSAAAGVDPNLLGAARPRAGAVWERRRGRAGRPRGAPRPFRAGRAGVVAV